MALPIIFKITDAGKSAALSASQNGAQIKLNLTQVAIGAGKYVPNGSEIALVNEVGTRSSIVSGDVETDSNTLRFSSSITASTLTPVYEIGLMTDGGILFAVAASPNDPFFTIYPDITFVTSFGLSLSEVAASSVTVVTDPNGALSIVIMQQHLAATDPHPQYLNQARFNLFLQTLIPYGYQYDTHTPSNPKPLFDDLLGIDTHWRRITGKIMLATDPNDDAIKDHSIVLGQRGMTTLASNERPHVYPLQTSHKFERYDPSTVIETVWRVSADKVSISEGDAVRFTVTANNLPDGQILDWSIKEGVLDSANNDIASPEKTDNGTVILRNGQAVIDFVTTADDNTVEPQKHVRLTVGAPASLSINVPIDDKGFTEKVIHISQSTTEGINLAEYYKAQQGSYPLSTDTVRFIVDAGVDIIAPNTATPAMTEGANWPTGNTPVIENYGRILGRGGNGGRSAHVKQYRNADNTYYRSNAPSDFIDAQPGEDGGVAVSGSLAIENYSLVAGGGGGGGGLGVYDSGRLYPANDSVRGIIGGGGSGGGAPLGLSSPNEGTINSYLRHWPTLTKISAINTDKNIISMVLETPANNGLSLYSLEFDGSSYSTSRVAMSSYSDDYTVDNVINSAGFEFAFNSGDRTLATNDTNQNLTKGGSGGYSLSYSTNRDYYTTSSISRGQGGDAFLLRRMAEDASVETSGRGGSHYQASPNSPTIDNETEFKDSAAGGDGGGIGMPGSDGVFISYFKFTGELGSQKPTPVDQSALSWQKPSSTGGLAGFIKQGGVTITNFGSGTTKGR